MQSAFCLSSVFLFLSFSRFLLSWKHLSSKSITFVKVMVPIRQGAFMCSPNKGSNCQLCLQSHLESDRCWFSSHYLLSVSGPGPQYKTQNFKHIGRERFLFFFVWIYLIEQEKPRERLKVSKRKITDGLLEMAFPLTVCVTLGKLRFTIANPSCPPLEKRCAWLVRSDFLPWHSDIHESRTALQTARVSHAGRATWADTGSAQWSGQLCISNRE